MQLINLHHHRVKHKDVLSFCASQGFTYIGRPTALGNLYSHLKVSGSIRVASRDEAVDKYRLWLWRMIQEGNQSVLTFLAQLKPDSVLACWCCPERCHGDVVIKAWEYLNGT